MIAIIRQARAELDPLDLLGELNKLLAFVLCAMIGAGVGLAVAILDTPAAAATSTTPLAAEGGARERGK